jgi:hypothetical protein
VAVLADLGDQDARRRPSASRTRRSAPALFRPGWTWRMPPACRRR